MIAEEVLRAYGATERRIEAGSFLFEEGGAVAYYYQLLGGEIRWSSFSADGEEILHQLVQAGESVGELPVGESSKYEASAIADLASVVLRLPQSAFQKMLNERPDVQLAVMQSLTKQLGFKLFLTKITYHIRPAETLLQLLNYFNEQGMYICEDCTRLMLTRQQIANMTGLRVETIIRAFKQLERDHQISIVRGKVFVPADGFGSIG